MNTNEYTKLFTDYLNGNLNEVVKVDFEKRLERDEQFSEAFNRFVVKSYTNQQYESIVEENTPDEKRLKAYSKPPSNYLLKIAAVMLILIIPSALLIYKYKFSDDSLINNTYMQYYGDGAFRGNSLSEEQIEEAFNLFREKKFEKAVPLFESIADTAAFPDEYNLYAGISLLWSKKKKDAEKAQKYFSGVMQAQCRYSLAAKWFYAISLYETGNKKKAKTIFQEFSQSKRGFKKQEAKEILEKYY